MKERLFKLLFFICLVSIEFLATTTIQIEAVESMWDKSNHFIAFFTLYILISLGFRKFSIVKKVLWLILFAVQIEVVQHFIEGRLFSVLDIAADILGIGAAIIVLKVSENGKQMHIDYKQIKKFLLSGGSATALHFTVMAIAIYLGLRPLYATVLGALSGAVFNYTLQYFYAFKSDKPHFKALTTYTLAVILGFLSNAYLFAFFFYNLKMDIIISQLMTTSIVTVQNYLVYKYFVFFKRQ